MSRLRERITLKNIPLDKIISSGAPLEEELQDSIKKIEQQEAIVVRPKGEGFEIVDGRRRFEALKAAGVKNSLCEVRLDLDCDTDFHIHALVRNSGTHNEFDEAEHIYYLMAQGYTYKQIAEMVRYSESTVYNRVVLKEKLHPTLFMMGLQGRFKVSPALEAIKLPKDEQERRLLNSSHKLTYKYVFEHVRDYQGTQMNLFDMDDEVPLKPGLFLNWEQVQSLLNFLTIEVEYQNERFNIKRS